MYLRYWAAAVLGLSFTNITAAEEAANLGSMEVIAETGDSLLPTFEQQFERFLRRPGAETVVSTQKFDSSHLGTLENILAATPGVYSVARGNANSGLYSIRGTDIASSGPRNGRGIRAYIDGVPLGRTEAGLTVSLIDVLAADYVEVYRGANSLKFGGVASGGALNFVSRNGINSPGTRISVEAGSYDFHQTQLQHGGQSDDGNIDYYVSLSDNRTDGYQNHSDTITTRLTSNLGWSVSDDVNTRFYLTVGRDHQEQGGSIPLNFLDRESETSGISRTTGEENLRSESRDLDRNFDYFRFANRTDIVLNDSHKIGVDSFILYSDFDHLPFNAIVDNIWREGGIGLRYDGLLNVAGVPTELTGGVRTSYTYGEFKRFQYESGGHEQADKIGDDQFHSLLTEVYGEAAFSVTDATRLFLGMQYVNLQRELKDRFQQAIPDSFLQGGSSANDEGYNIHFTSFNPKIGLNIEFADNQFFFTSLARSFEVPTGSDVKDVVVEAGSADFIKPQRAWTYEIGTRGGDDDLFYDLTLYYSKIRDEILTRCGDVVCSETVAFNADHTIHSGIELGLGAKVLEDIVSQGDALRVNTTFNYNNFKFDDDDTFGDKRLPVIPQKTLLTSFNYSHASGFYSELEYRYASERGATYDGSGGDGWEIPSYETLGITLGYKPKNKPYSFYVQGVNITDEIYASTFTAEPTQPTDTVFGMGPPQQVLRQFVDVRPANGEAYYAGFTYQYD